MPQSASITLSAATAAFKFPTASHHPWSLCQTTHKRPQSRLKGQRRWYSGQWVPEGWASPFIIQHSPCNDFGQQNSSTICQLTLEPPIRRIPHPNPGSGGFTPAPWAAVASRRTYKALNSLAVNAILVSQRQREQ